MSYLKRDYDWYYCGTWLGLWVGENTYPFYIDNVIFSGEVDEWGDAVNSEEEEDLGSLSFEGYYYDGNSTHHTEICVEDYKLIYELPNLGVFDINGRDTWLRYMPQRSVKKGLSCNRVFPNVRLSNDLVYQIFSRGYRPNKYNFSFVEDTVLYKGSMVVGKINGNDLVLTEGADYLAPMLEKQVEETNGNGTASLRVITS